MNVNIRLPVADSCSAFITAMQKSEVLHHPWVEAPKTQEAFDAYIEKYALDHNISYWVFDDNQLAGVININQIVRGFFQSAFLGYYAIAGFTGKGVMTVGLRLVVEAAFEQHGLHRLEANIQPGNTASIELVRRCGFVKEGFSKNYLQVLGQWRDHERWAITADH